MMGPMTPGEIRAKIRERSGMTEGELAAMFDRQIAASVRDEDLAVLDSLRLFRDALLKETKRKVRRPAKRGVLPTK